MFYHDTLFKKSEKSNFFHFCLQTNEQCYHLLELTNHSSAFQPVSGTKLNMLYPRPVSGTKTGAKNWPVCHHYKFTPRDRLTRTEIETDAKTETWQTDQVLVIFEQRS